MSKRNFVCFRCRVALRRQPYTNEDKRCPECRQPCHDIGYKVRVPAKSKVREWATLKQEYFDFRRQITMKAEVDAVRKRHSAEKRIVELEGRPKSKGRDAELKRLKRTLDQNDA